MSDWYMKEVEEEREEMNEPTLQSEFCGRILPFTVCEGTDPGSGFLIFGHDSVRSSRQFSDPIITSLHPFLQDADIRYVILGSDKLLG
jgi:hypothetical protein